MHWNTPSHSNADLTRGPAVLQRSAAMKRYTYNTGKWVDSHLNLGTPAALRCTHLNVRDQNCGRGSSSGGSQLAYRGGLRRGSTASTPRGGQWVEEQQATHQQQQVACLPVSVRRDRWRRCTNRKKKASSSSTSTVATGTAISTAR